MRIDIVCDRVPVWFFVGLRNVVEFALLLLVIFYLVLIFICGFLKFFIPL